MAALGKNGNLVSGRLSTLLGFHRLAEAIALAIHFKNMAPVGEPVQESPGHALSLENLAPLAERQVAGDEHTGTLVAVAEDPEQEFDATATERHISQLVADQQVRPLQLPEEFVQRVLLLSLFELADQLRRREEAHPQTLSASSLAQGDGDVTLPSSLTPDKAAIVIMCNPFASRQFQDLRLGELRQGAEIERVEVLQNRKPGVLDPRRNRVGGTGPQLEFGETEQELKVILTGGSGVPRQLLEFLAHRRQPQLPEMSLEQVDHRVGHQHGPPQENVGARAGPASRVRSSSGQTRSGEKHADLAFATSLSGGEPLAVGSGTAAGFTQKTIEAAQVRQRHLDLRQCDQLGGQWR
jgi:hypothetical protein